MKKGLLFFCVIVFILNNVFSQNGTKSIKFEDVISTGKFRSKGAKQMVSLKDGENYVAFNKKADKLIKYKYETGDSVSVVFDSNDVKENKLDDYSDFEFSEDESKILFSVNSEAIYRHSSKSEYYVFDLKTKKMIPVSENGKQQLATFSPDASKVAFVRDNNLFIKDLISNEEFSLTNDGKYNEIINGAPDWVYEEEFGFSKAFEWSQDGRFLAWIKFDESRVKMFNMTEFAGMNPIIEENILYPENKTFKYPKAGEDNSIITVLMYDFQLKKTVKADIGSETDIYIPRIRWTKTAEQLCVFRLNRLQNQLELLQTDATTGKSKVFFTETNKYYLEDGILDNILFLDNRQQFIIVSEKDGWNQIYLYDMNGNLVNQITKGNFDVINFYGCDEKNKTIYYQAAEVSPLQKEIYSTGLNGKNKKLLTEAKGSNYATFNQGFKYFINRNSSLKSPSFVSLFKSNGKQVRVLENNKALIDTLKNYKFNYAEVFSFTTSEGVTLNGTMLKPPDFDPNKKYPVFMYQYSGPNSLSAMDIWSFGWEMYLAQKGYIYVVVDGRGTANRGEEFRKMTYLQLGKYEEIDQVETAKYLSSLLFIDGKRIGIWGWSYGGFISSLCMVKGNGAFKLGIAVAPVTNWRYYDNIYTERYMKKPQENPEGYDDNSPINFASQLQGKLLLCHGTADDNVHLQNTLEFSEKLVQANKQFDMQIYTNRNHNISGGKTRLHLYTRMTNFILENL